MGVGKGSVLVAVALAATAQAGALPAVQVGNLLGAEASCEGGATAVQAVPPVGPVAPLDQGGWHDQSSPTTRDLWDVAFADADHGWAVGDGVILGTSDGGTTWRVQREDNRWHSAVVALGPDRAWVLSVDRQLLETTDRGATWTERLGGGWVMDEQALAFDGERGWFAGMDAIFTPNLWREGDEGTWSPLGPLPPANEEAALRDLVPVPGGVLAVGTKWNGDGLVLRTTDDGATWCSLAVEASLQAVDLRGGLGFAAGTNALGGALFRTLDGGASWTPELLVVAPALRDVAVRDAAVALAVGDDGTALLTTSGGLLWTHEAVPTLQRLHGVAVAPPTTGDVGVEAWAVGDGGTIEHRSP